MKKTIPCMLLVSFSFSAFLPAGCGDGGGRDDADAGDGEEAEDLQADETTADGDGDPFDAEEEDAGAEPDEPEAVDAEPDETAEIPEIEETPEVETDESDLVEEDPGGPEADMDAEDGAADGEISDVPGEDGDASEELPPLRPCTPVAGDPARLILRGTVLTPESLIWDGEVLVLGDTGTAGAEHISCVGEDCSSHPDAAGATLICTEGIILPGLVDSHNHLHYNTLPVWRHEGRLFEDRYEWQGLASYDTFKDAKRDIEGTELCRMVKYAEARVVMGGAVSAQGVMGSRCIKPLARNLEWSIETSGLGEASIRTRVPSIGSMAPTTAANLVDELDAGTTEAFVPHLSEGINEASRAEFDTLESLGLLRSESALIHGTGGGAVELAKMAAVGAKLIWSPNSNIDLYGMTTRVTMARLLGVPLSLAPDWTPSLGFSMLEELKCADHVNRTYLGETLSDAELVKMVTSRPAEAMGLGDKIGYLVPGRFADVTVIAGDRTRPWRSVVDAGTTDVLIVLKGGTLLFGDAAMTAGIASPDFCEDIDVCGAAKTICPKISLSPTDGFNESLADIESALLAALDAARSAHPDYDPGDPEATYQYELFPLMRCEPPPTCTLGNEYVSGVPTAEDIDGDDAANLLDNCETIFNPRQEDSDLDGIGDDCDPCPFDPSTDVCSPVVMGDIDNDGYDDMTSDNCPRIHNPGQEDSDGDGKGDACDRFPTLTDPPGVELLAIYDIQHILSPHHPEPGTIVRVEGAVVTAVRDASTNGFWMQDPAGGRWSGIYVYLGSTAATVMRGDIVNVQGEYREYQGVSQITNPTDVEIAGSDAPPDPITVDPADAATGSMRAEGYEDVLIRVEDVTVVDENPDEPSDYNEFMVTGGLRVDDYIYAISPDPVLDQHFTSLKGVLYYAHYDFKLLPRDAADAVTP